MTDSHALISSYRAAFAAGSAADLDRCYEPGAILVPRPGTPLTGAAHRIPAHQHLLSFAMPDGRPLDLSGTATDVARRGADGRWRYVIDNPFGVG